MSKVKFTINISGCNKKVIDQGNYLYNMLE